MSGRPLLLGQITDLHLRSHQPHSSAAPAARSRAIAELLPRALAQLKERGCDLVALTGDLVDVPLWFLHPHDYYRFDRDGWQDAVLADYRLLHSILDDSGLPCIVLPGNHDHEPSLWQVFDGTRHEWEAGGFRVLRFCDREWVFNRPRRIDRELKRWRAALADEDRRPQIHLQHYPILPHIDREYPYNYREAEFLRHEMAASGKVALSLAGHFHGGSGLIADGGCTHAIGPAFAKFPHRFRLHELRPGEVRMETFELLREPVGAGRRVVFLDRDGVINDRPRYNTGPEDMHLIPGAGRAILALRQAGFAVVVVSNQSCIGSGNVLEETVQAVHDRMCQLLVREAGDARAQPDALFYSRGAGTRAVVPELADTSRAKPATTLLDEACEILGLRRDAAWMVGDALVDIGAARNFGATPVLVETGHGREMAATAEMQALAPLRATDLAAAAELILRRDGAQVPAQPG